MAKFIKIHDDIVLNIELIVDYRPWEQVPPNTRLSIEMMKYNTRTATVDVTKFIGVKFSGSDQWQSYRIPFAEFDRLVKEFSR